jgi:uncharacterized protein DUF3105
MFSKITHTVLVVVVVVTMLVACAPSIPSTPEIVQATAMPAQNGFQDKPALPNDSGIEGVRTFPDKAVYHNHIQTLNVSEGDMPPVFGAHFPAWQNCGIYNQPVELGSALHSMEHGAVWLTYRPDLDAKDVSDLQALVRGHGYVLMSPYATQKKTVVLTAWGVQLVIDTLPDARIAKFIKYYEQGPQDSERGAPCSGAVGEPLP